MRVKDFMTSAVITIRGDTPVKEAARLLVSHGYNLLPVVDDDGDLLGVVSEAHLIDGRILPDPRALIGSVPPASPTAQSVAELMTKDPVVVDSTVDPAAVARLMLDHDLCAVPVVQEGRLAGIVTRRDVLGTLTRDDHDIAQDIRARLRIVCRAAWGVEVANGVVTLTGHNAAPADRRAARIVAAARPGVLAVRVVDTSGVDAA
jgi:CBS domain-containing protein